MRTRLLLATMALTLAWSLSPTAAPEAHAWEFVRGDTDANGSLEITDGVRIFGHLFLGDPVELDCLDAADTDDSGVLELTDGIYLLGHLFLGDPAPPEPFLECGTDPTPDDLDCVFMPACGGSDFIRSPLERDASPDVSPEDLEALVEGNTAFALDLYAQIRDADGNLFFSPHSISGALAMTHAGARGETEQELAAALRFGLPQERLHPAVNYLDLELSRRGEGAAGHAGGGFQLRVVNAAWGQLGYSFLPAYLDVLALSYDAGLRLLDFEFEPEASRVAINNWVSAQTEERIRNLLQPGTILPTTRLVLTNAIYFSAAWKDPFPKQHTKTGDFKLLDGSTKEAPFMTNRADFGYAATEGCEAVEILYDGEELSMVLLVPPEGSFRDFEASLDGAKLRRIVAELRPGDIQLTLPKFSCETELSLVEPLRALGVETAFVPGAADFSGIDGTRYLFVSGVVHKAFVAVDEFGTEAAAATAVIIGIISLPRYVTVDRPFIYVIRDIPTGAVLFLGRVLVPAG